MVPNTKREQHDGVLGIYPTWPPPLYPSASDWDITVKQSTILYNPSASSYILQPEFHHLGYNPRAEAWWCAHAHRRELVLIWAEMIGDDTERWLHFPVLSSDDVLSNGLWSAGHDKMKTQTMWLPLTHTNSEAKLCLSQSLLFCPALHSLTI